MSESDGVKTVNILLFLTSKKLYEPLFKQILLLEFKSLPLYQCGTGVGSLQLTNYSISNFVLKWQNDIKYRFSFLS